MIRWSGPYPIAWVLFAVLVSSVRGMLDQTCDTLQVGTSAGLSDVVKNGLVADSWKGDSKRVNYVEFDQSTDYLYLFDPSLSQSLSVLSV